VLAALAAHCKARRVPYVSLATAASDTPAAYPPNDSILHIGLRACRLTMLRWMMDHGFGPAMLLTNAQGHSASDLVAALLPKLDKAEMKASGKGAKSALPAAGDKDKDKGKKKKPPKNVLHGCTMEAALSRLGADGVKGMLELSKVMAKEEKVAAAAAAAKAKQDAADAKKRAEAEAKAAKAKGGPAKGKGGGKAQMKVKAVK